VPSLPKQHALVLERRHLPTTFKVREASPGAQRRTKIVDLWFHEEIGWPQFGCDRHARAGPEIAHVTKRRTYERGYQSRGNGEGLEISGKYKVSALQPRPPVEPPAGTFTGPACSLMSKRPVSTCRTRLSSWP